MSASRAVCRGVVRRGVRKVTTGITGLWLPSVHGHVAFWSEQRRPLPSVRGKEQKCRPVVPFAAELYDEVSEKLPQGPQGPQPPGLRKSSCGWLLECRECVRETVLLKPVRLRLDSA